MPMSSRTRSRSVPKSADGSSRSGSRKTSGSRPATCCSGSIPNPIKIAHGAGRCGDCRRAGQGRSACRPSLPPPASISLSAREDVAFLPEEYRRQSELMRTRLYHPCAAAGRRTCAVRCAQQAGRCRGRSASRRARRWRPGPHATGVNPRCLPGRCSATRPNTDLSKTEVRAPVGGVDQPGRPAAARADDDAGTARGQHRRQ